jgi:DNA repair protein RadA/Sms
MKVSEPAMDLGIVLALVSSYRNRPVDSKTIIFGEVGLAGEVRAVSQPQLRINEAVKLGFTRCILPQVCLKNVKESDRIQLYGVRSLGDAINIL